MCSKLRPLPLRYCTLLVLCLMLPRAKLYKAPKFRRKTRENTRRNEQERSVGEEVKAQKKMSVRKAKDEKKKKFFLRTSGHCGDWRNMGISDESAVANSNHWKNIWNAVDKDTNQTRGGRGGDGDGGECQ